MCFVEGLGNGLRPVRLRFAVIGVRPGNTSADSLYDAGGPIYGTVFLDFDERTGIRTIYAGRWIGSDVSMFSNFFDHFALYIVRIFSSQPP